jgi:hypothetical protein
MPIASPIISRPKMRTSTTGDHINNEKDDMKAKLAIRSDPRRPTLSASTEAFISQKKKQWKRKN